MMTRFLLAAALGALSCSSAFASGGAKSAVRDFNGVKVRVNYDRNAIPPYVLEDPLVFADGRKVVTAEDWKERRAEILGIFAREMYGAEPPKPETLRTELVKERVTCDGHALRRQYAMRFRADGSGPCLNWLVWSPTAAKGPVPVILLLNYRGAHEFVMDDDIPVMAGWSRNGRYVKDHRVQEDSRGLFLDPNTPGWDFPLQTILARGYAVMTACYCEVSPDPNWDEKEPYGQVPFAYTGVFELWGPRDESRTDNVTSLGAWAWALSRGLDLAERIPELDAKRSVVTGCSRLGKAALIAAARDERFAVCVPNQCGGGGVCLAKRDFGESVGTEIGMFRHWYCRAYDKYAADPAKLLTFDQHLLLASIAPRPVLVEGMSDSDWMDTEGEFLACRAAAPVWRFLGHGTMPSVDYPDDYGTEAIGERLGYVRRPHSHGLAACDWNWMMDFADRQFAPGAGGVEETKVWQARIDAAAASGGGRVTIPAGRHLVGQLDLRSGVELRLEKGAVLEGMVGLEHYRIVPLPHSEGLVWSAVVMAVGATNVAITGEGEIFGNGGAWQEPERMGNHEGKRARGLLFANCRDVRLEGFTLRDTACWGCVFKCCDGVTARRVRIDNHSNFNNDGFDIEAKNVLIEACDVDSGDDAYCLKSNDPDFAVENVLVTNCVGRSHCNVFKLGTASHGTMRNIRFVDCRSEAPRRDFRDRRRMSPRLGERWYTRGVRPGYPMGTGQAAIAVENVDGGIVEDISYENIRAYGVRVPIFIRGGTRSGRACGTPPNDKYVFRNVRIRNVRGEALFGLASSITGVDGCRVKGVLLEDIDVMCEGATRAESEEVLRVPVPEIPGAYPDAIMFNHILPAYGLYVDRVDGLVMDNVSFRLKDGSPDVRKAVVTTGR